MDTTLQKIQNAFDKTVIVTQSIYATDSRPHLTVELSQSQDLKYSQGLKRFDQDCYDCFDEGLYIKDGHTYQPSLFNKLYKFIVPDYYFCQQVFRTALLLPLAVVPTFMLIKKLELQR